ncbi:MAG: Alpha/beta knot methyltransferase [Monoraphidium minutum]|nr:MAG: Alpha/beta knot methyltransferase [Monoraphidium minutum]
MIAAGARGQQAAAQWRHAATQRVAAWRSRHTRAAPGCAPPGWAPAPAPPGAAAASAAAPADLERAATPHDGMSHPRLVFPHTGDFEGPKGRVLTSDEVARLLSGQVSEQRLARLRSVVAARCYGIIPVIEGLHDVGNMSAVCRSADALGLGAVHCVVNGTKYKQSQRTTAGAEKWLDVKVWTSTESCLGGLKRAGYQIVTTALSDRSVPIQDIDWTRPTAFVMGNERDGVTQAAVDMADAVAVIPMMGFVESFNVSVAAALIMWEAQQQRMRRLGRTGDLSPREAEVLLSEFLIRGVVGPQGG